MDNRNKDGLSGYAYDFSVDYNTIEVSDIIDNDKYLLKKNNTKQYLYYLQNHLFHYQTLMDQ